MTDKIRQKLEELKLNPDSAEAYNDLGIEYSLEKEYSKAIQCYRKALQLNPDYAEAYYNLANVHKTNVEFEDSVLLYKKAIELKPDFAEAYYNLGNALKEMRLYDDALTFYKKALELNPSYIEALNNIGVLLHDKIMFKNALELFHRALALDIAYPEAHFNRALTLLLLGNFKEGWEEHEWRWEKGDYLIHHRDFSQPHWNGSDIKGKTILLHAEQGYGDTLQFIRYAPLIAQMGAKVIVECQPALVSLLKNTAGVNAAVSKGEAIPDFDLHCPILSLPLAFKTELSSIPANIPYIRPSEEIIAKWEKRIGGNKDRLKVGISWAGNPEHRNDRNRSCGFEVMKQLLDIQGIDFYSLQVLNKTGGVHPKLIDFTEEIRSFEDTAGLISSLDLIVAVDTAVGHLGGAMGKEVWIMLPYVPDWRWLIDRDDSPWYPSMRLFRQTEPSDWNAVIDKIFYSLSNRTI
ncbi:MAG: tetratricopeptide repeat protein [Nitrospirae bacterium]|nr:tetratricopeptide repeat protein [Nitrospirota bacterium]